MKLNLSPLQAIGLLMIVFALGANEFIPGAVVYYSTTQPTVIFEGGQGTTSPNNPGVVAPNSVNMITVSTQGISQSEILNNSVQISMWTGSAWTVIQTSPLTYRVTDPNGNSFYQVSFTFGTAGTLYALSFALTTSDLGSFHDIGYVETQVLNGYFLINGQVISNTTVLRVSDPTLAFTYNVTTSGITGANLRVVINILANGTQIGTITLPGSGSSTVLTGSYTLPAQGQYTIQGFVTFDSVTYQQMDIMGYFGISTGSSTQLSFSDYYFIVAIFGLVFVVLGARQKKKKEKDS